MCTRPEGQRKLVPEELKSNPTTDALTKTQLDLAKYTGEVLNAQGIRRFILGFTLYGSTMRLWELWQMAGPLFLGWPASSNLDYSLIAEAIGDGAWIRDLVVKLQQREGVNLTA